MTTAASAAHPPDPGVSAPSVIGCPDLDARVLYGRRLAEEGGLVVGISADGDIGLVMALSVVVCRLRRDPAASARLVTTLPAAHVVRLLRDVIVRSREEEPTHVLRRVLVSRIYGHDDLAAVLDELEGAAPFPRLWSASAPGETTGASADDGDAGQHEESKDARSPSSSPPPPAAAAQARPPSVIVFTEMDHHFKWMRLQGSSSGSGGGGDGPGDALRLHAQYGQLLRRLRGLAVPAPASTQPPPLVLVLNGTFVRMPTKDAASPSSPARRGPDDDSNAQLAMALLQQQQKEPLAPALVRLCCEELARAQRVEPRYHGLMNHLCSLHVCCTRLPPAVARLVDAKASSSSSLWVVAVENDEQEISHTTDDRIGVVRFAQGTLHDALCG